MSIGRGLGRGDVVHTHSGILLSHKRNKTGSLAETWMDPESVIQSEVSRKEKNKYHALMHISERQWQPTLVLLPGKSHGRRRLVGYSPWGHKESDMTK